MTWYWSLVLLLSILIPIDPPEEYTVLISCGDVYVKKQEMTTSLNSGEIFTKGQSIQIGENGFVSLTDKEHRKVELSEIGEYSFEEVRAMFEGKEKSLYSRLLASVIKLMTETEEEEVTSVGAVLRGHETPYLPQDSSIIMDSVFALQFSNEFLDTLNIILRDAFSDKIMVKTKTVSDSLLIADLEQGTYIWEISDHISVKKAGFFLIPGNEERELYLNEYRELSASMSNWPDTLAASIVKEWALSRKLVWSVK